MGWINEDLGAKWKAQGLPIENVYPTDAVTGQIDAQAIVKGAQHLADAKSFIDFLGTKSVHEIVRDATVRRSARKDTTPPAALPDMNALTIVSAMDPRPSSCPLPGSPQQMRILRDNWFVFSIVALLLCGLTIVVPQLRLMAASLLEEGGASRFCTIRTGFNPFLK